MLQRPQEDIILKIRYGNMTFQLGGLSLPVSTAHILNFALAVLFASLCVATPTLADQRDRLNLAEFFGAIGEGPIGNHFFLPIGEPKPPQHELSAELIVSETDGWVFGRFPAAKLPIFSDGGRLIPAVRGVVRDADRPNLLNLIVSPGRVWSEPGDSVWSRASFPFALTGLASNRTHNGIAMFLYNDREVSPLVFQIVQETSPSMKFDEWGKIPITLNRNAIEDRDTILADYLDELATRLPVHPLSELAIAFGTAGENAVALWPVSTNEATSGIVVDGKIYSAGCPTRYGPFPYCDEMRHGVQSVSKSLIGLVSLLWLAEEFGDEVLGSRIVDYLDVTAEHGGWSEVTFRDAINMATGVGDAPENYAGVFENGFPPFSRYRGQLSAEGKLKAVFSGGNYPWGPGEILRYRDMDSFVLSAAMDSFLKSRHGPDADLYDVVRKHVLRPIGAQYLPINHTIEEGGNRGIPILSDGIFPTFHEISKIALLLQRGGRIGDQQLLSATTLREALYQTEARGLQANNRSPIPGVGYHLSLWHHTVDLKDCSVNVPTMSGMGGHTVLLLPSEAVVYFLQDGGERQESQLAALADMVHPQCQ